MANMVLLDKEFPISFIDVSTFAFPEQVLTQDDAIYKDPCLARNSLEDIGKDIEVNGTYWLTVVDPATNTVIEGTHRVAGLQLIGSNKKMPCLYIHPMELQGKFDERKFFYIPVSILYDNWIDLPDYEIVDANDRIAKIYTDSVEEFVFQILGIAMCLNKYIQFYQMVSGQKFRGSPYLNNEDMFKELRKLDFVHLVNIDMHEGFKCQ